MRKILWTLVILLFAVGIFVLGYSLTEGPLTLAKNMAKATKPRDPLDEDVFDGYFKINKLKYFDRVITMQALNKTANITDRCDMKLKDETLILELLLSSEKIIDHCEVFIDNMYSTEIKILEMPSIDSFAQNDTILTVSLPAQNIYDKHLVEICCDSICHTKKILELC